MLSHIMIWQAIDKIAQINGLTASGLARKAGLDATTFNKSKRFTEHSRPRWPSMESIIKVLQVLNMDLVTFAHYAEGVESDLRLARRIPMITLDRHTYKHHIQGDGQFIASGDLAISMLSAPQERCYALTLRGSDFAPHYREGDTLIISTNPVFYAGSRMIALTHNGLMIMGTILQENTHAFIVETLEKSPRSLSLPKNALQSIHRILWVSQ